MQLSEALDWLAPGASAWRGAWLRKGAYTREIESQGRWKQG